jgi:hypothetical protein
VPKGVHTSIDTGSLAVPNAKDAIEPGRAQRCDKLAPHNGGNPKFLIDRWAMNDFDPQRPRQSVLELAIEARERGTLVARYEGSRSMPI